ncbi:MAG: ATP-binding cassette domain-containing protein [Microbacterium sp.]|jgi:peptide/nickel transport system ATP-binding protein|nr:ATP-binding cassette domain-containing protein [Microbacterium sp.]
MSEPMIVLRDVGKTYHRGRPPALAGVDLEIAAGTIVAVVGESGSGKSTLGKLLVGLATPSTGEILVDGKAPEPVSRRRKGRERPAQMVFQDVYGSLNPSQTIGFQLNEVHRAAHPRTARGERTAAITALVERVGLRPASDYLSRRSDDLSGGQRQRVGIARALATDPRVIVADEPTSMLDVSVRREILDLLAGLRTDGVTIVYITHDLLSAGYLADRVVVLHHGEIVEDGSPDQVLGDPQHPYTQKLAAASPGLQLELANGAAAAQTEEEND